MQTVCQADWHELCSILGLRRVAADAYRGGHPMSIAELTSITVRRIDVGFGAEIVGVDVRTLHPRDFRLIENAFNRHGVIVVRDQILTPKDFHSFVERLGELETHTLLQYTLPGDEKIYVLANIEENGRQIGAHNEGIGWHTDLSYKQKPVMATALYGVICPPVGADTLFADMSAAYDALPEARKRELDGLKIHHSYHRFMASRDDRAPLTEEQKAKTPDVHHPLVRTHPATGRKSLYIGTGTVFGIVGMSNPEGKALVDELVDYATQEKFTYRHVWRENDILMWDNRSTLHTGTLFDDTKYKRLIYRMMVKGDTPF
jgi:taurine dioxygenase